MQIKQVENTNSKLNFGSKHKRDQISAFVNADDSQLKAAAYEQAIDKDEEKKQQNSLMGMFYALPIVDTIASGILVDKRNKLTKDSYKALKYSQLSTRAEAAVKTAGTWGFILVAVGLFNATKKALGKQSPELKEYENNHPIVSFVLDIGAVLGVIALSGFALKKFAPEKVEELKSKFQNSIAKLDETKFNEETLPKLVENVSKVAKKVPRFANGCRIALVNSVWIFLGASLLKSFNYAHNQQKKVEQNYQELKQKQLEVAKYVANTAIAERDILAKNQALLLRELKHQTDKANKPCCKEDIETSPKEVEEESQMSRTHHPEPED